MFLYYPVMSRFDIQKAKLEQDLNPACLVTKPAVTFLFTTGITQIIRNIEKNCDCCRVWDLTVCPVSQEPTWSWHYPVYASHHRGYSSISQRPHMIHLSTGKQWHGPQRLHMIHLSTGKQWHGPQRPHMIHLSTGKQWHGPQRPHMIHLSTGKQSDVVPKRQLKPILCGSNREIYPGTL